MGSWRDLSDEDLAALGKEIDGRVQSLAQRGVNIQGLGEHYIITLLEEMLSPASLNRAKEKHYVWTKERLDEVEPQIRQAQFMAGLNGAHPPLPPDRSRLR